VKYECNAVLEALGYPADRIEALLAGGAVGES
jgi:hypothetical protein